MTQSTNRQGKLYAMGTGPGSSDLITVRAARLLGQLDILYAPAGRRGGDSLALSIVREYLGPQVEVRERHFPMSTHADEKESLWDQVAEEIRTEVEAGHQVGFITLGDAMLFSTWVFLLARLQGRIPLEVIPGVTSFACIAARAVFPLAMEQQTMAVVSCTAPEEEVSRALAQHDCVVLMKVYGRFPQVRALLARHGLLGNALLMAEASLPSEQCFRELASLRSDVELPYFSTILVNKQWSSTLLEEVA